MARLYGHEVDVAEIEEVWHVLRPPYEDLFAWLEGRSERPSPDAPGRFRPVMLAQAIDEAVDFARLDPADYAAEWKWDGIRVQAVAERGEIRLWSRTGEDVSAAFPDVVGGLNFEGVIDGELLVLRDGRVAPFGDLQQRLNRKTADAKLMAAYPAGIRAYDLLLDGEDDIRQLPFAERRARLEAFVAASRSPRIDLSPLQPFETWAELAALRAEPPPGDPRNAEGVMLKRWDSIYEAGRPKGPWFKWKRDPHLIDAVLMYAQRGHGKRSSFYSDYTFGVWREDEAGQLQPDPGRQGLFRLHRRGAEAARQVRARQHRRTLRPGARACAPTATSAWCWRWPSKACNAPPATAAASPCASQGSTASAGTSPREKPTNWRRWKRCWSASGVRRRTDAARRDHRLGNPWCCGSPAGARSPGPTPRRRHQAASSGMTV